MVAQRDGSTDLARWEAVRGRDAAARPDFVFAVSTTGIYCRPGCTSKTPRRENVAFFDTWQAAEQAGFRACKRCQPRADEAELIHARVIEQACQAISTAERMPRLEELAQAAGLSRYHFHRLFRQVVGITPRQYYQQARLNRLQVNLPGGESVTTALYEAGFGAASAFYRRAAGDLGMPPHIYRQGGTGMQIRYAIVEAALGWVLVAATASGICAIELGDTAAELETRLRERFPAAEIQPSDPAFQDWVQAVLRFLSAPAAGLDLPLDIQGTAFQRRVWQALREIPAGSTASYTEIAQRIGKPAAVRAVAQACAANKIAVAIPCHRAVRADGSLSGYRWGVERKKKLLEMEKKQN